MDVVVGVNTYSHVTAETLLSLAKTWNAYPDDFQSRLILVRGGCADFAGTRNRLVREFLSTGVEWLLIVDTDMAWEPQDWERLRDSASEAAPIVAGLYFVDNDPPNPCCVIFDEEGTKYAPALTEDSDELVRVHASGLGFSLIHRDVFLKSGDMVNDHEWFEHGTRTVAGETMSEDYAFAARVALAGFPIYVNSKVRVGHVKSHVVGWDDYRVQEVG